METKIVRAQDSRKAARGGLRHPAILAGFLLVSPIFGAGCNQERAAPLEARAEVTCKTPERELDPQGMPLKVRGRCENGEVTGVDIRMPCGSPRFQQHCRLILQVPSTTSMVRRSGAMPIEINVADKGESAEVTVKRAEEKMD